MMRTNYITSILNNELYKIATQSGYIENKNYSDDWRPIYYNLPILDENGNPPLDESIEIITPINALQELLNNGANLLSEVEGQVLLSTMLSSNYLNIKEKEYILSKVNETNLKNLPILFKNKVIEALLYNGNEKYLNELYNKGLLFEQSLYLNESNLEIKKLKHGSLHFFKNILNEFPNSLDFNYEYIAKEDYEDIPKNDAVKTTLKIEIEKILKENIITINNNDQLETAHYLYKYILSQDLSVILINNKKEKNQKIKI